jgi:type IV secretory pathway TraG/TraD family ATPase VirD4
VQALLMLIRGSEYPDLMLAQSILSLDKLPERLMAARESINPWIYSQLGMLLSAAGSEKTVSSILAMANKVFTTFMKPEILSAFCGKTTFPTKIEGKTLLVLGLNREYGDTLSPLLATILDLLVTKNVTFQRKDQLCLFLDEMPTLYLPRISGWVTQNREDGLAVLIGIQNKVQLEKIYSKEEALEIMGSCANKNIYNPQDLESAKFYSDYIGDTAYIENQRSRGRSGSQGSSNTTRSEKTKKLISPEEIDRMPQGKALIITPGHADRKEAYIPLLHQFKPSKEYTDLIALNERKWDESIRQKLIERSQQKVYIGADLKMRFNYADRWFPVPAGGKAQKTNPNNIAGGIPDNDVIAQGKKLGIDRTSFTAHLKNY